MSDYVQKLGGQQPLQAGPAILPIPAGLTEPKDPLLEDEEIAAEYTIEELEAQLDARITDEEREIQTEIAVSEIEEELAAKPEFTAWDHFTDVAAGVPHGILTAADEAYHAVGDLAGWFGLEEVDAFFKQSNMADFVANETGVGRQQGTISGDLSAGVTQFLAPFGAVMKAAKATQAGLGAYAAGGAFVDATFFDPHDARLSDLLREHAGLRDPITEYLAADPEDTAAEGRLKNALEGLGIGGLVDGLVLAVRGIRGSRTATTLNKQADDLIVTRELADEPEPEVRVQEDEANINNVRDDEVNAEDYLEEPAAVQPRSAFREEQFRSHLELNPKLRDELAERISNGDLNAAEDLIDFNANTVDWDKLEEPDQVFELINTTSDVLGDFIDDTKGGVQSLAQTRKLAGLVGGTAEQVSKLFADVRGGHGITARMFAAQKVLTSSADRLRVLAKKAASAESTKADELAFLRQVELHGMVQAQIKGAQTEIARSLHAMRSLKAASANDFKEFDDIIQGIGGGDPAKRRLLANEIAKLRDENGINKVVRRSRWQKAGNAALEIYINGLLSSISTQTLNNVSNAVKVIEGVQENYIATGIGKIRTARAGANPDRIRLKEANARAAGTLIGMRRATGITWENLRKLDVEELAKAFKESPVARAATEEKPVLDARQRVDADTRKAIAAIGDGLDARAINAFGKFIRLPGRMIMTSDEFFKNVNYQQELSSIAYRHAADAADARGLTGAKRQKTMTRDIDAMLKDPPDEIHFQALDYARYQTFQADLEGSLSRWMESGLHKVPALRIVIPFFRTPVNIVKQATLERSPFALASAKFWKTVAKGGPEADVALARLITGTTAMSAVMMATLDGNITGSGLNNGPRRNTEALDGVPPYSIKIGDTWYQYNRFEPLGLITGLAADLVDIYAHYGDEQLDELHEIVFGTITALTQNITDKTWFKGIGDLVQALEDPKRYARNYAKNLSTGIVPYSSLLRRTAADFDETSRQAWTLMDTFKSKLPGLSATLPPRRDLLGNEVIRTDYLGPAALSPFAVGVEKDDPVYAELARLEMYYENPERDLFNTGEDVDSATYSEFMRIRGQEQFGGLSMQESLEQLFRSPEYEKELTDLGKQYLVKRVMSAYTRAARAKMMAENPDILDQVIAAKRKDALDLITNP